MKVSGELTRQEIDNYVAAHPEVAFVVMCSIADALGVPVGKVTDNNQPNADHIISCDPNTTLDLGTKMFAMVYPPLQEK